MKTKRDSLRRNTIYIMFIVFSLVGLFLGGKICWTLTQNWTEGIIVLLRILLLCISACFCASIGMAIAIAIGLSLNEILK